MEKDEGLTYLDHRGGGLVIFGSSVLVDGHGDELYCLSIHFGRHVVVLLVRVRRTEMRDNVLGSDVTNTSRRRKVSSAQTCRRLGERRVVRTGGEGDPTPKKKQRFATKRGPSTT